MTLTITIKNFPSSNNLYVSKIKAAILRIWKIDLGRNENDINFEWKE